MTVVRAEIAKTSPGVRPYTAGAPTLVYSDEPGQGALALVARRAGRFIPLPGFDIQ